MRRWMGFLLTTACTNGADRVPPQSAVDGPLALEWDAEPEQDGLSVRLGAKSRPFVADGPGAPSESQPLAADAVGELIARLPPVQTRATDRVSFHKREDSTPPPLAITPVDLPFPPPPAGPPPEVDPGPPTVLRYAPEGDIGLAPHLSITFSQPMIAVTTQESAAAHVPVLLSPEPAGSWRWLGTRTLLFEPDPRFPMATEFTATVRPGTASATGAPLLDPVGWSFRTPPPKVVTTWPTHDPQPLEPLILVGFDQKVDPRALGPFVRLEANGRPVPLRFATAGEVAADETVDALTEGIEPGRYAVFRPEGRLEPSTGYVLVVAAGTPSAEGPLTTERDQTSSFSTFSQLAVEEVDCAGGHGGCRTDSPLWIRFNNPLDEDLTPERVVVTPPIEGMDVRASGSMLTIFGDLRPKTSYLVTVSASLADTFGQTLGVPYTHTFDVGDADPALYGPGRDHLVLDPGGPPVYPVFAVHHERVRLRVWQVTVEDYPSFSAFMRDARHDGSWTGSPPGRLAVDRVVPLTKGDGVRTETGLDLAPYLDAGKGHLVVWVEPEQQPKDAWNRIDLVSWVQATELGLTAFADAGTLTAWATSLATGAPISGAEVSLLAFGAPTATDADGVAVIGKYPGDRPGPHALVARLGDDVALLPDQDGWWNQYGSWFEGQPTDSLRWFVFDDRAMYRPGEAVHVKGWVRQHVASPGGAVRALPEPPPRVAWTLTDHRGVRLGDGEAAVTGSAGFDLSIQLPATPNLGTALLDLAPIGGEIPGHHRHTFQIQEFRRPEFEVTTQVDPGPYVLGGHAWVETTAAYFAGGGLPDAPVAWDVTWSPTGYTPPNRSDYRFGAWIPWWRADRTVPGRPASARFEDKTDALGTHTLQIDFLALRPAQPMSVRAEATVVDVNRQRWTSSASMLLHPASRYVGVKPDRGYYERGEPIGLELIVVDLDGAATPEVPIAVELAEVRWIRKDGDWTQEADPVDTCAAVSGTTATTCRLEPERGGLFRVTATIRDPEGRPNRTEFDVYVTGEGSRPPPREVALEELVLVPKQDTVTVGDTLEVLVQSPFWPADGLMLVEAQGVMDRRAFHLDGPTTTLELQIRANHEPDFTLQVDVVGSAPRTDDDGEPLADAPRRPAFASGSLRIPVPPERHRLAVAVTPREAGLEPGGSTVLDLTVRDAAGQPVAGAEVAVIVVDEAVLALTGFKLPDPVEVFWAARSAAVRSHHGRSMVRLADPTAVAPIGGMLGAVGYGVGGGGDATRMDTVLAPSEASEEAESRPRPEAKVMRAKKAADNEPSPASAVVAVRSNFDPLALFAPSERTSADGRLTLPVTVPDNLTRYRIMAVAVTDGVQFGAGEATITARLPLMLRPSPPRFLNFGDRAELPWVVQNQTDAPLEVAVAVRVTNAAVLPSIDGPIDPAVTTGGRLVSVPAGTRREIRIPIAADLPGTARFQAIAQAGRVSDAAELSLPVWTPATSEAFATYGEIDRGALRQPIAAPADVWPSYGGLEITTSTTAVAALTDAVLYLQDYPYDCSEQLASRVMAVAALRDVLEAFDAEGLPPPDDLDAAVVRDLERLERRQAASGGWGFYPTVPDEPFLSVHVADALSRAERAGYPASPSMTARTKRYLERVEAHIPSAYGVEARRLIVAHALAVRAAWGDADVTKAKGLVAEAGDALPIEAAAWLLPVLHAGGATAEVDRIVRRLELRVTETAAGAQIDVSYTDDDDYVLLHSSRRTDALVLDALIQVRPTHDVVPKLVRGLLGHRVKGRWGSTQENAYVLLGLHRYFVTFEGVTPDLVARVWLGDQYAGEHAFRGRTAEQARIDVPMAWLTDPGGTRDLVVQNDGKGRLYYRIGLRYAPTDLVLAPADHGFELTRAYEAVDDPADVSRDPDGTWQFRAGARVRARVTMVNVARRTHVMLVDPVPAGLEILNPELVTTGTIPADPSAAEPGWWWRGPWYQHQNLRDERAEAFTTLLWSGVWTYTWVGIATTPGRFVVPPAKAEEMFHPETFGRTGTDRVVVR